MRHLSAADLKGWEPHMTAVHHLLPKEAQQSVCAHSHVGMTGSAAAAAAVVEPTAVACA